MQIKKSEKASLEKDKLVYALMGLVLVLSLCYVALEWAQAEVREAAVAKNEEAIFEEELEEVVQTQQETLPPPPPPPAQEIEELTVVDDDEETESIEINSEDDQAVEIEIAPPAEVVEEEEPEDVIFVVVESMPEFPGGAAAMYKFLSENIRYPVIAQENNIQGRVICQFTVNKDGSLVDVEVIRQVDPALDKEAIRVIKAMPKWNPGKQRGKPVRVKYTIPVNFKLQ
ncbi:MAG: energy transducer TonB [Paludibacteraceae bacterium]|nr:energy transducer TonB [Paludibacteraceae bacterium]